MPQLPHRPTHYIAYVLHPVRTNRTKRETFVVCHYCREREIGSGRTDWIGGIRPVQEFDRCNRSLLLPPIYLMKSLCRRRRRLSGHSFLPLPPPSLLERKFRAICYRDVRNLVSGRGVAAATPSKGQQCQALHPSGFYPYPAFLYTVCQWGPFLIPFLRPSHNHQAFLYSISEVDRTDGESGARTRLGRSVGRSEDRETG